MRLSILLVSLATGLALSPGCRTHARAALRTCAARKLGPRSPPVQLGLFDFFAESEEQKAAKEAAREAEFQAQQEMLARRRNPELREEYEREVGERRECSRAGI